LTARRRGRSVKRQERRSRLHRVARLDVNLEDFSRMRTRQLENRLIGFDFHNDLIGGNRVAYGHAQAADFRFVDIFTDGRQRKLNAHGVVRYSV
jgi:hypothetical protein